MDAATQLITLWFPKLQEDRYFRLTSPATPKYNCIAWAAAQDECNLWPYNNEGVPAKSNGARFRWPRGIARDLSVESFHNLFRLNGFEPYDGTQLESGYEYICLYVNTDNEVTHAARQLPDGTWTSKLGQYQDIRHSLHSLEGEIYGKVHCIMRRQIPSANR